MRRRVRVESDRDQSESAFTFILRRLFRGNPQVVAVVFIDADGEYVDYVTSLEPFEAKVMAAQWLVEMGALVRTHQRLGMVPAFELTVCTDGHDFLARRIDEGYSLFVVTDPGGVTPRVRRASDRAALSFLREAGLPSPPWTSSVSVDVRSAVGWGYAPESFVESGQAHRIAHVLGQWVDEEESLVCFRVRTEEGEELALGHDRELKTWLRLTD